MYTVLTVFTERFLSHVSYISSHNYAIDCTELFAVCAEHMHGVFFNSVDTSER